ncbi:MAG: NUDIX domain-containing protein [Acidimicrobiales bacterium]
MSPETGESPSQVKSERVAAVRATVAGHEPSDERESASKARILEELDRLESPFEEDADPVHFTGSAIVVGPRGTILHLHKRLGLWMQTGGHLEDGEMPHDAALRESEEETGLALAHVAGVPRLLHIDVHAAANGHTHLDLRYLLLSPDLEPSPPPGESPHARWFSWAEALERSDEALIGALRAARSEPEVKQWADVSVDDRNRF